MREGPAPTRDVGSGRWQVLDVEDEDIVTPEETLVEAGITSERQAKYQRRLSSLLAGRA